MSTAPLSPAQAAALRRARELAGELAHLVAAVRAALAAEPDPAEPTLAPGDMRAALAAAASSPGRRPRELFGG
jgi:hypothetical protein